MLGIPIYETYTRTINQVGAGMGDSLGSAGRVRARTAGVRAGGGGGVFADGAAREGAQKHSWRCWRRRRRTSRESLARGLSESQPVGGPGRRGSRCLGAARPSLAPARAPPSAVREAPESAVTAAAPSAGRRHGGGAAVEGRGLVGSGPRYQISSHFFARCASQKTHGHARIARETNHIPPGLS